mmetsp:Transcript_53269/g.124023  ORF Transcript_53269/g.124023 Transcript_53269/m.124023 type:complete len:208 (-) Transcript_53269:272-895(-)
MTFGKDYGQDTNKRCERSRSSSTIARICTRRSQSRCFQDTLQFCTVGLRVRILTRLCGCRSGSPTADLRPCGVCLGILLAWATGMERTFSSIQSPDAWCTSTLTAFLARVCSSSVQKPCRSGSHRTVLQRWVSQELKECSARHVSFALMCYATVRISRHCSQSYTCSLQIRSLNGRPGRKRTRIDKMMESSRPEPPSVMWRKSSTGC